MYVKQTLWIACVVIVGCSAGSKPTLIGKWATTTAPDQADTAETLVFLESGEWQQKFIFTLPPGMVNAKTGEPFKPRPVSLGGSWKVEGDKLHLQCAHSSVPEIKFDQSDLHIKELTANKLVLEEKGKTTFFFRVPQ
jgi:hypothetical protein